MDNKVVIAIVAVVIVAVAACAVVFISSGSEDVPSDVVRYKGNGGTTSSGAKVFDNASPVVVECMFIKDGYHCVTWNTKSDGSGTDYPVGSTVPLKTVLYAQWSDQNVVGAINYYFNTFNLFVAEKGNENLVNIDDSAADIPPNDAILVLYAKKGSQISVEASNTVVINDGTKTYKVILSLDVQGLSLGNPKPLDTNSAVYYDINQSTKNQTATLTMAVSSS